MEKIRNRSEAGKKLSNKLLFYKNNPDAIVLALPRGGVPVAFEISKALNIPLDVLLVRKLGVPGQEELAMGAITINDVCVLNDFIVKNLSLHQEIIDKIIDREKKELERRNVLYRESRPFPEIKNNIVILVDDGLATGATMRAVVTAIRQMKPKKIIIAVPVSAYDTYLEFQKIADEIICLETPEPLYSIGLWYDDFAQTTDEEVQTLLSQAKQFCNLNP